jgi:hypothetical protein
MTVSPSVRVYLTEKVNEARANPNSFVPPTPYELSRLGYEEGATSWAGKSLMLGSDWYAVKKLLRRLQPQQDRL